MPETPYARPVLDITDLRVAFRSRGTEREVLHGISLQIGAGEKVALVGESGSGKSVTARVLMGLLRSSRDLNIAGSAKFEGTELITNAHEIKRRRGRDMSMIFQDPTSSLNPFFTIAEQFREVLSRGGGADRKVGSAEARAIAMLQEVSIREPERVMLSYPFQLSGGMNQRVMIAMALANRPKFLIADEPGTALDVTVQAQTLRLMHHLVTKSGAALLLISHNLGVVREFADRVYVIYRGRIVEEGSTAAVFARPGHAYTKALLAALPHVSAPGLPDIPESSPAFGDPKVTHAPEVVRS